MTDLSGLSDADLMSQINAPLAAPSPLASISDADLMSQINGRDAQMQNIANDAVAGKRTMAEALPEIALKDAAGNMNDAVGAVGHAVYDALPDMAQRGIKAVGNAVGTSLPYVKDALVNPAIQNMYAQVMQQNPRVSDALDAGGNALNLATALPAKQALNAVGDAAGSGVNALSAAMGGGGEKIGIGISEHLDNEAAKAYADAHASGVGRIRLYSNFQHKLSARMLILILSMLS